MIVQILFIKIKFNYFYLIPKSIMGCNQSKSDVNIITPVHSRVGSETERIQLQTMENLTDKYTMGDYAASNVFYEVR